MSSLVVEPDGRPTVTVAPGKRLIAGSSAAADLILPGLNPQHAVFYHDPDQGWLVAHFGAEVRVNDSEPIFAPTVLAAGDRVRLGPATVTVVPI
jgi:hypothetical protein